jgi:transcriptional regulator GlxA family with amidase domain
MVGVTSPLHRVGILIYRDITMIDVAGPADVFTHANRYGANYATTLISVDGADTTASNGLGLQAHCGVAEVESLDTLIVPGAYGMVSEPFAPELVEAVRTLSGRSRRIASVCTGPFLLAEVGLLDGRKAVTHWDQTERFRRAFPEVDVQDDCLFVHDGDVITGAGIGSGLDLALDLVEDDHGADVARRTARQMVIFLQRPGGMSQFPAASRLASASVSGDKPLRRLLDAVAADPTADYSSEAMARIALVSTRQLSRLFQDELGTTPAKYVESVRLEAAQMALRNGHGVAQAARLSGFGGPEQMRRVFVSRLGVSPSLYLDRVGDPAPAPPGD